MRVVLIFRKAFPNQFSIEQVFRTLLPVFPAAVDTFTLPWPSKGFLPRIKNGLATRRQQADVYHITGDSTYLAPFLNSRRTILTFHDFDFIKRSRGVKRWLLFFFWVYLPVKYAAYITTISAATKADLLKLVKIPADKIQVIPNPLTLTDDSEPAVEKNNTLPVLLHIGTKANKNLERLIPALEGLNVHLEIVGQLKPHQRELLQKHQIQYQNSWNISQETLIQHYRQADLLTFVSTIEGFGLPIVEAQALGCPVLTSSISSMPEVAGAGAYLVDPYDVSAIRNAVQELLSDSRLRATLIEKGYQNVQRFQPQQIAEAYTNLYEEIITNLSP